MKIKRIQSTSTTAALILAITTTVYSQEKPAASTAPAAEPASGKAFMHFEGTDLHLGTLPAVTFHGFFSQGFLYSDNYDYLVHSKKGSFEFTELGVNASFSPFARTRISAQGFLFDVGHVGKFVPGLDYAIIDYSLQSEIGFRAGRIRRPEGIYNSIQDIDLVRTSVLLPQGMYDARYRDFSASVDGASMYGDLNLNKAGSLSYEIYGGLVNLSEQGGIARLLQDSLRNPPTQYKQVNGFPQVGIQTWWSTPLQGLRAGFALTEAFGFSYDYNLNIPPAFGGGAYHSVIDAPAQHYSLEYLWKAWTFQAEYKYSDYFIHNELNGVSMPTTHSGSDVWYVSAAYRATKWFEVGVYYTENYADIFNRSGKGNTTPHSDAYQKDLALSFRFDPKPWWVVKLEFHAISGTALLHDTKDNPNRNAEIWPLFAAKTTFSF